LADVTPGLSRHVCYGCENNGVMQPPSAKARAGIITPTKHIGASHRIPGELPRLSRTVYANSPAVLCQLGLQPALEAECATFSKLRGIRVDFWAETIPESLPEPVALCLYRVAQECLQNIRKHARTYFVGLRLSLAHRGRAADPQNRSALHPVGVHWEFRGCPSI
jgi:signal transduction histidine kinase